VEPQHSHRSSSRQIGSAPAIAAAVTLATAVVAMAAREPLSRTRPLDASAARVPLAALALLLAGAVLVGLAALVVLLRPGIAREDEDPVFAPQPPQIHWMWKLLAVVVPLALGAALVLAAILGTSHQRPAVPQLLRGPGGTHRAPATSVGDRFTLPAWVPWTMLGIAVTATLVGCLIWLRRNRARSRRDAGEPLPARAAVQSAIGALETTAEPRAAVVAAYAAMERIFDEYGMGRSSAEAPREYLRRVLAATGAVRTEAGTLTALFEEARFSTHPVKESSRQRALAALVGLRARMQSTDPPCPSL
jgi:hypothetical protein